MSSIINATSATEPTSTKELSIEQRRIIYQARRGLKELDFYIDPYVKDGYLTAPAEEQAAFARLLSYEDPDLLAYFLNQDSTDDVQVMQLIEQLKRLRHG